MIRQTKLNTPWTLHFDRNGTEDIAIICDSNGSDLATSRDFWKPEGSDASPPTLVGMRLMVIAPKLLELAEFIALTDLKCAADRRRAKRLARRIIAQATDDSIGRVA